MNKQIFKKLKKNKQKSNLATFLKLLSIAFLFGLIFFSLIILIIRFLDLTFTVYYISVPLILLICFIIVILQYRKKVITKTTIASILDKESSSNGLLLAALEMDTGEWQLHEENIPYFKYRWKGDAIKLLYGILIATICFFIPMPTIVSTTQTPLDISSITEEIIHNVENLSENGLLEEEEKEEILTIIEELKANADALKPSETFESLNSIEESIENIIGKNLNDVQVLSEQINEVASSMEGIDNGSGSIEWNEFNNNLSSLDKMLKENTSIREQMTETIAQSLEQSMENSELSEYFNFSESMEEMYDTNIENMEALRDALQEAKESIGNSIENSIKSGSIDPESLEALKLLTEEQLAELIEQGLLEGNLEEYLELLEKQGIANRGGGPGDRNLNNTEKDFDTDNLVQLNSEMIDIGEAEYMGYNFVEPEIDIIKDDSGGILGLEIDEGGVSRKIYLAPHQRQAVEDYFNRE